MSLAPGGTARVCTPEAFRSAAYRSAWVAPATGFTGLVDALRDYLVDQGVTMLDSTRLVAAETCPQGLDLEFLTSVSRPASAGTSPASWEQGRGDAVTYEAGFTMVRAA